MNKKDELVLLVFADQEFTAHTAKHTHELSDKLLEVATAWLATFHDAEPDDAPSSYAVGAAFYAALWKLSNQSPSRLEAMRKGCAVALLSNDAETRAYITLASAPIPDYHN